MNFNTSHADFDLIIAITKRAEDMQLIQAPNRMTVTMNLIACHLNGCEIALDLLAVAKPLDFAHDVLGICRHIDTETGALLDCFSPRYARCYHPRKEG